MTQTSTPTIIKQESKMDKNLRYTVYTYSDGEKVYVASMTGARAGSLQSLKHFMRYGY